MDKQCFINALTGERNQALKNILIDLIKSATKIENYNGKVELYVNNIYETDKGKAYALASWDDYENSNALITNDLASFKCTDLGGLITKLRIN